MAVVTKSRIKALEAELPNGEAAKPKEEQVQIKPLRQQVVEFEIEGVSPFAQLRFSQKAKNKMMATQQAGSQAKSKRTRDARDFEDDYKQSHYRPTRGGYGIPAAAFRNAAISACRTVGFKMTLAKLSIFVEADDVDKLDGTPLVYLLGEPEQWISQVRNDNGSCDLRVRALWRKWSAKVRIRFDLDQFSLSDIANLMHRIGQQVGVGEGRPDSRNSAGLGFGLFRIKEN